MSSGNVDVSSILNRILDTAADNLRVAKILVLLGLDPNNVTYDAIFNRLLEIVLSQITLANMCLLIGSIFFVATLLMRTMMPLRISNIISNVFLIAFGALGADIKTFLMYLLLLPINVVRLHQMRKLVKMARNATKGDKSMEWLKPFMTERKYRKGDKLMKKGDNANEMFLTVSGKFLVTEFSIELPPGTLMGELGFLTPTTSGRRRSNASKPATCSRSSMTSCWRSTFKIRNSDITSSFSPASVCWRITLSSKRLSPSTRSLHRFKAPVRSRPRELNSSWNLTAASRAPRPAACR